MVDVHLYVEGGGDHDRALRTRCQAGFRGFLESVLEKKPKIIPCGGREQAFDRFRSALRIQPHVCNMLLVDAEAPVTATRVWDHLGTQAGWERPAAARDDSAHLMVQCMEAWLVADRESTAKLFGAEWNAKKIPKWNEVEKVSKQRLFDALFDATKTCAQPYAKGELSFELLGSLNANVVMRASPHAKALVETLRRHLR